MTSIDLSDFVLPVVLVGSALLLRGTIAPTSRWSQYVRASYVTRSRSTAWLPFSYQRLTAAMLPGAFAITFLALIPTIGVHVGASAAWLMLVGLVGALILTAVAFIWPRPFAPRWMQDADSGRATGVDPAMIARVERANRPLSDRTFRLANLACFALALIAVSIRADGSVFFGIFLGWAMLVGGQHAR